MPASDTFEHDSEQHGRVGGAEKGLAAQEVATKLEQWRAEKPELEGLHRRLVQQPGHDAAGAPAADRGHGCCGC